MIGKVKPTPIGDPISTLASVSHLDFYLLFKNIVLTYLSIYFKHIYYYNVLTQHLNTYS